MTAPAHIDFTALKAQANGMLGQDVYRAIYDAARGVAHGDILEIGTAHGAATIALALGLAAGGGAGRVITADKIAGGSREQFGGVEDNIRIITGNFRAFGVDGCVDFYPEDSVALAARLKADGGADRRFALMMLDADGAIDRDFRLFYDRLAPGAPVIIDDYQPGFVRAYRSGRTVRIDQKRRLTALLVHHFEGLGMLARGTVVGDTWFGKKPENAPAMAGTDTEAITAIYRHLVFSDARLHGGMAEMLGNFTRRFPALHGALKRVYLKS